MAISDPRLLEFLACPQDKGALLYLEAEDVLYNPRLKAKYQIKDGIPVLLASEATTADAAEDKRLVAAAKAAGQDVES